MKFKILLLSISFVFTANAQHGEGHGEAAPVVKVVNPEENMVIIERSGKPTTSKYTETQFRQLIKEESEKYLKRIGKGDVIPLSQELLKKEDEIKLKELAIKKREEEYQLNVKELSKKIKEFDGRQQEFISCTNAVDDKKEKRISHMVDSVANMKPQVAADVLSVQAPEIAVEIISKLDSVKISKIFNLMDKEVSARLQKQYLNMKK